MGHPQADTDKPSPAADKPARKIGRVDLVPAAGDAAAAKAVRGLPGFKDACGFVAAVVNGGADSVFLDWNGQACDVHWRTEAGWQAREPLGKDAATALLAVFKALAAPLAEAGQGVSGGGFVLTEQVRRSARITLRKADKREQMLVQLGPELPAAGGLVQRLGGMVTGLLPVGRRKEESDGQGPREPTPLKVELQPQGKSEQAADAAGLEAAATVFGRALAMRACGVRFESAGKAVTVRVDVDGVWRPFDPLDRASGDALIAAVKAVAGLATASHRPKQSGACISVVEGKPWPCIVVFVRAQGVERLDVLFQYGQPKFKTLADTGMPEQLRAQVQALMGLAQGVVVVAAPRRNGLSTLFEHVVLMVDRLMRDLVSIEDVAAPQREIQNVKTARWDATAKVAPLDAVEKALREYPQGLIACDLTDADLAKRLVELAEQEKFVVLGVNAGDAAEGIATILGLGVPSEQLGRLLLGGIGSRLVRKLCPRCREEYLPSLDELAAARIDAAEAVTFWRAPQDGCEVCGGTGYLGRTGIFEIASGRTLQHYVAKAADASTLRKAAAKDGTVSLTVAAIGLVKAGVTSLDEVRRVMVSGSTKQPRAEQPAR